MCPPEVCCNPRLILDDVGMGIKGLVVKKEACNLIYSKTNWNTAQLVFHLTPHRKYLIKLYIAMQACTTFIFISAGS